MKRKKSAGGVVLNDRGEVLVVNQNHRSWSLPKGHIDPGEDELTAAKREIYEESGVKKLELVKKLGSYHRFKLGLDEKDDRSEMKTITLFLFRTSQNKLSPIDPKHPEARWVAKGEVAKMLTHPKDKAFFEKVKGSF